MSALPNTFDAKEIMLTNQSNDLDTIALENNLSF